jgi:hypothetical protein
MEILVDNGLANESRLRSLMAEAHEILAIGVSSAKTARASSGA